MKRHSIGQLDPIEIMRVDSSRQIESNATKALEEAGSIWIVYVALILSQVCCTPPRYVPRQHRLDLLAN